MQPDDVWADALREVESDGRQPGLWARCFAEAGGDEGKAKAAYIKARVDQLAPTPAPTPAPPVATGFCPNCDKENPLTAERCSRCGAVFVGSTGWTLRSSPTGHPTGPGSRPAQTSAPTAQPMLVQSAKSRGIYIALGLFLGMLGIHNFYIGRIGVAVAQLATVFILGWFVIGFFIVGLWVLVELFVVTEDAAGNKLA